MSALRVLFIGGSGIISSACCHFAVQRGIDLYALNRGTTQLRPLPAEVTLLKGDVRDPASLRDALAGREFDVAVNWADRPVCIHQFGFGVPDSTLPGADH
ncbi:MAG TPA: NAD-dependent epimerase/dehydratase family protein [Propionibacteriaceae bacterium]|nr:NAD-dependent epimerase/dehydratase family protein [Propionibacteriaceae bacterium]